jgi:hypothetical protein
MLDEDREGVILQKDEFGKTHELRYEAVSLVDESSNILPMKTLKEIVSYAKDLMNDPDYAYLYKKIIRGR